MKYLEIVLGGPLGISSVGRFWSIGIIIYLRSPWGHWLPLCYYRLFLGSVLIYVFIISHLMISACSRHNRKWIVLCYQLPNCRKKMTMHKFAIVEIPMANLRICAYIRIPRDAGNIIKMYPLIFFKVHKLCFHLKPKMVQSSH